MIIEGALSDLDCKDSVTYRQQINSKSFVKRNIF